MLPLAGGHPHACVDAPLDPLTLPQQGPASVVRAAREEFKHAGRGPLARMRVRLLRRTAWFLLGCRRICCTARRGIVGVLLLPKHFRRPFPPPCRRPTSRVARQLCVSCASVVRQSCVSGYRLHSKSKVSFATRPRCEKYQPTSPSSSSSSSPPSRKPAKLLDQRNWCEIMATEDAGLRFSLRAEQPGEDPRSYDFIAPRFPTRTESCE